MNIIFYLFFTHIISYWLAVACYSYIYQQWSKESPKVVKQVLINQIVFTPFYIIPFQFYPEPISTYNIVWQLPAIVVLTDIIFYTCHRYFHLNKTLYALIHKSHHEYDPPIASAALYAHPIEHLFINLSSTIFPLFIVRANVTVAVIWTIISSVNVVVAHSGTWPGDPHTAHHKYKTCNYGVGLLLLDRLFHTFR